MESEKFGAHILGGGRAGHVSGISNHGHLHTAFPHDVPAPVRGHEARNSQVDVLGLEFLHSLRLCCGFEWRHLQLHFKSVLDGAHAYASRNISLDVEGELPAQISAESVQGDAYYCAARRGPGPLPRPGPLHDWHHSSDNIFSTLRKGKALLQTQLGRFVVC